MLRACIHRQRSLQSGPDLTDRIPGTVQYFHSSKGQRHDSREYTLDRVGEDIISLSRSQAHDCSPLFRRRNSVLRHRHKLGPEHAGDWFDSHDNLSQNWIRLKPAKGQYTTLLGAYYTYADWEKLLSCRWPVLSKSELRYLWLNKVCGPFVNISNSTDNFDRWIQSGIVSSS